MMKEESARSEIRRLLDEASVEASPVETPSIHGNGNILNSRVTVKTAPRDPAARRFPCAPRRHELLDAVRAKAARLTLSEDQVCEIAARQLRKKVVVLSLARLAADDLALVYEALSSRQRFARSTRSS